MSPAITPAGLPLSPPAEGADAAVIRPRMRRKEARPSEILDAALDVFAEKGFAAARLDEIAARAGVSKGTLYLYFASKEELLKAVVQTDIVGMIAEGRAMIEQFEGPTDALLEAFMQRWWELQGETKSSAIMKIITSEAQNFPEVARFYASEVIEPAHAMLESLLRRGVARGDFAPIEHYADVVHAMVSGVMFLMNWKHSLAPCVGDEHIEPRRFIQTFARLLIDGLAPRAALAPAQSRP